jgi:predicted Zn-ribbon and HTH transcriptional regulator
MKPDDYYEQLSKVAVYRVPNPKNPGETKEERTAKRQLAKLKESDWQDDPDTAELVEQLEEFVKPKKNYTVPIEIVKLKIQPRACEDCGLTVTDRRVNIKVVAFPERHWRRSCTHCRKTYNPETLQYDLSNVAVQNFFYSWLKRRDK